MSDDTSKPASKSLTIQGLGTVQAAILGVVVTVIGHRLGVTDSGDLATLKHASGDILTLVMALVAQIGVVAGVIGRARAKGPLSGVVKPAQPAPAPNPAEDPPY